jgi:hypothetical protein
MEMGIQQEQLRPEHLAAVVHSLLPQQAVVVQVQVGRAMAIRIPTFHVQDSGLLHFPHEMVEKVDTATLYLPMVPDQIRLSAKVVAALAGAVQGMGDALSREQVEEVVTLVEEVAATSLHITKEVEEEVPITEEQIRYLMELQMSVTAQ